MIHSDKAMACGNILLVDDSPSVRMLLEDRLSEEGYSVVAADNGRSALEALSDFLPDLVITDITMPEMDGFGLCRKLKEDANLKDVPVIMLTAATEEKEVCQGLGLGVSDYIRKPFSPTELILRVQNILRGTREKNRLKEVFSRHTSPEVVCELLEKPDDLMLSGELRQVTVLFADIRGFTRMVSGAEPAEIVSELNLNLTVMSEAVIEHGGTLDKFLGDGIMALFGAPLAHDNDDERAVRAAIEMQRKVKAINQERTSDGRVAMWVGIGIASGPAVVGNIGSNLRMEYTAIGDCVNMASRLQALARGGEIIISEDVFGKCPSELGASPLSPVVIKGKPDPVAVYSLMGI